jgi:hypothetical protein
MASGEWQRPLVSAQATTSCAASTGCGCRPASCGCAPRGESDAGAQGAHSNPPGPLPAHPPHRAYMECSECLPTRLNPVAERARFSQVRRVQRHRGRGRAGRAGPGHARVAVRAPSGRLRALSALRRQTCACFLTVVKSFPVRELASRPTFRRRVGAGARDYCSPNPH